MDKVGGCYLWQSNALGSISSRETICEGKKSNEDGLELSADRSNKKHRSLGRLT